jgi:DNA-binding IclR family transcriptional regulator
MRTDSGEYVSPASQVLLAVVAALGRRPLEPQTIVSLSAHVGASRDQVFRALRNMEAADWAERLPSGWRLSPEIVRISERYRLALADAGRNYLGGV